MRRIHLLLACLSCSLVVSACGDSTGPVAPPTIAGTYSLQSVNGGVLPFLILEEGADRFEVVRGVLTLKQDSTFSDLADFRITVGGEVETWTDTINGRWSKSATTVTFRGHAPSDPGTLYEPYVMTHAEETLTQTIGEFTLVFKR